MPVRVATRSHSATEVNYITVIPQPLQTALCAHLRAACVPAHIGTYALPVLLGPEGSQARLGPSDGEGRVSAVARSVAVWAGYAFGVGLLLLVVPNFLLGLFRIEETNESWVRVLGAVVLLLAFYYLVMALNGANTMFRATVYGRGLVGLALAVLAMSTGPWQLVLFAAADAAGAAWTQLSLHKSAPASADAG